MSILLPPFVSHPFSEIVVARFLKKIIIPENIDACWEWGASRHIGGYGQYRCQEFPNGYAHIFSQLIWNGPIPEGFEVDHGCVHPPCVNPFHLEAVTPKVNVLRSSAPMALQARQTHCIHGHPFDEANTYVNRGHRLCRECHRLAERRRRHDQRQRSGVRTPADQSQAA